MAGMLRVPRSRGALSGALLVLLGLWGALVPFVGPYFHFAYTPGTAWTYTSGRLWLEILPGAVTAFGGLILLASRVRPVAMFGAWLAALGGAWFAVGRVLSPVWNAQGTVLLGTPIGGTVTRALVELSYFTGLGVIIVFLAALSLGRLTVVGVRDARLSGRAAEQDETVTEPAVTEPAGTEPAGTEPAGTEPAGSKPADTEPAGTKPADTEPATVGSSDPVVYERPAAERTEVVRPTADST